MENLKETDRMPEQKDRFTEMEDGMKKLKNAFLKEIKWE